MKKPNLREAYEHREYTSGKVTSKHHYKYGRIEVKAKHPKGRGLWPAIWMMPQEKSKFKFILLKLWLIIYGG